MTDMQMGKARYGARPKQAFDVMDLSAAARSALLAIGTNRQGAVIAPGTPSGASLELRAAGYTGPDNGLTRAGSIARQRLNERLMEAMF